MSDKNEIKEEKKTDGQEQKKEPEGNIGMWIGIGLCFGSALGVLFDNIALGISIGLAVGAGLGSATKHKPKDK